LIYVNRFTHIYVSIYSYTYLCIYTHICLTITYTHIHSCLFQTNKWRGVTRTCLWTPPTHSRSSQASVTCLRASPASRAGNGWGAERSSLHAALQWSVNCIREWRASRAAAERQNDFSSRCTPTTTTRSCACVTCLMHTCAVVFHSYYVWLYLLHHVAMCHSIWRSLAFPQIVRYLIYFYQFGLFSSLLHENHVTCRKVTLHMNESRRIVRWQHRFLSVVLVHTREWCVYLYTYLFVYTYTFI